MNEGFAVFFLLLGSSNYSPDGHNRLSDGSGAGGGRAHGGVGRGSVMAVVQGGAI